MTTTPASDWYVRPERPEEAAAVREVNLSAFDTADEADLVDALRADPDAWLPGLSCVAEDGSGEVAAHALLTRCTIGGTPALALAPCAVLPRYQRQGAGSAAIRGALEAAREQGEHTVVVLGHAAYYPRFGFTPCAAAGITPPAGQEWPDEAFLVLSLGADGATTPSGPVHYPRAFGI